MEFVIDKNIARRLVENNILRNPKKIKLDGVEMTARLGDVGVARKAQLAGFLNVSPDAELIVALPDGAPAPIAMRSTVEMDDAQYEVAEVRPMTAADCYQLTISKII